MTAMNEEHIKKEIRKAEVELYYWKAQLKNYLREEYAIRKKKCLEVESDRHDYDRADKALEHLRRTTKDD